MSLISQKHQLDDESTSLSLSDDKSSN